MCKCALEEGTHSHKSDTLYKYEDTHTRTTYMNANTQVIEVCVAAAAAAYYGPSVNTHSASQACMIA